MHAVRAVVAVLVLVGGLMMPGGELCLAAPAAALSLVLIHWELVRSLPRLHWVAVFVPVLFGLLAVNRLLVDPVTDYGDEKFLSFITLTAVSAACACLIRTDDGFTVLARVWTFVGVYLTLATLVTGADERAAAFGANPIWVGRGIAAGFVLTVWATWTRRIRPAWGVLAGLIMLVGMVATGSRGPLLGAAVGALVVVFFSRMSFGRKLGVLLVAAVGAALLYRLPFFQDSRVVGIATGEIADDQSRSLMFSDTLRIIVDHTEGVGYGNWGMYSYLPHKFRYPHNLFLEVLAEHGVAIGLVFAAIVVAVLVGVLRRARTSQAALGVAAWLVAEIVNVSVSGDLNARTFFFALTLAFLFAVGRPGTGAMRGSAQRRVAVPLVR